MSFEWPKMYKVDEWVEREVTDAVYEYVFEYYGVNEVTELTPEQINEVEGFRDGISDYSPMQWGFSNLINMWESETWEEQNAS